MGEALLEAATNPEVLKQTQTRRYAVLTWQDLQSIHEGMGQFAKDERQWLPLHPGTDGSDAEIICAEEQEARPSRRHNNEWATSTRLWHLHPACCYAVNKQWITMMLFGDYGNFIGEHKGALPFIVSAVNWRHSSILYGGGPSTDEASNELRKVISVKCGRVHYRSTSLYISTLC